MAAHPRCNSDTGVGFLKTFRVDQEHARDNAEANRSRPVSDDIDGQFADPERELGGILE